MPLDENAKQVNVIGSVQEYFDAELSDVLNSSAPSIDFGGGMPFKDDRLEKWIQVRMLAPARPEILSGPFSTGGKRGQELFWVLNVNLFVRPGKLSPFTNLALPGLRDLVIDRLMPGRSITVKDYGGEGETIGYLIVKDIMEDRAIYDPQRTELLQHNLVVLLRWTETWL